jgi:hypothetical protein
MYHFSNQSVGVVSIYRRRMDSQAPGFAADGSADGAAADILFWGAWSGGVENSVEE